MSTLSYILIEKVSKIELEQILDETYMVGKREIFDYPQSSKYFDLENRYRTFCIHQECNLEWTQLEYDLENIYEFDEILRRLTKLKQSKSIIGYKQTTSGEARFALFESGQLKRSIVQKYIEHQNEFRTVENFGARLPFENITYESTSMKPMEGTVELLDFYNDIQIWIKELGFNFNGRAEEETEYIHLEIKNYKN